MDVIKVIIWPSPRFASIIDLELQVGGNIARLDGREIGSDDFSLRVLFGEIDGPDTGSGSEIEDTLGLLEGGKVELAVKKEGGNVMENVKLVLLFLIIRAPVLAFLVTSVSTTIFETEGSDLRVQGGGIGKIT